MKSKLADKTKVFNMNVLLVKDLILKRAFLGMVWLKALVNGDTLAAAGPELQVMYQDCFC